MKKTYKIGIIGTGFVGSAVSCGFEHVLGDKVEIREHDKYKDTESLESVCENCDHIFVCLPTPMNFETGKCDTSIIEEVIGNINKLVEGVNIIIKSTVPPGTTEKLAKLYPDNNFVFSPEYLVEKTFIEDFINQDRIVLGSTDGMYDPELIELFQEFTKAQKVPAKIYLTDSTTSEFCKYMANSMLACRLSFCNEMYQICEKLSIDYDEVSKIVSLDKRIGSSHMKVPGPDGKFGWSLSCFPKDLNALIYVAKSLGVDPIMLETTWTKNLMVREDHDWLKLKQVSGKYKKEK